jgi:hypothetical protein
MVNSGMSRNIITPSAGTCDSCSCFCVQGVVADRCPCGEGAENLRLLGISILHHQSSRRVSDTSDTTSIDKLLATRSKFVLSIMQRLFGVRCLAKPTIPPEDLSAIPFPEYAETSRKPAHSSPSCTACGMGASHTTLLSTLRTTPLRHRRSFLPLHCSTGGASAHRSMPLKILFLRGSGQPNAASPLQSWERLDSRPVLVWR